MDVRKEALRIARELRREFQARGEFRQTEFREELIGRLRHLDRGAYDVFVDKIAEVADREATADRRDGQPALPGFEWVDFDGEYRCGDNIRIVKEQATYQHYLMAMELDNKNLFDCMAKNVRKREEGQRLKDYWTDGRTKRQAFEAYRQAHPRGA